VYGCFDFVKLDKTLKRRSHAPASILHTWTRAGSPKMRRMQPGLLGAGVVLDEGGALVDLSRMCLQLLTSTH
jgi:hypothetical protein